MKLQFRTTLSPTNEWSRWHTVSRVNGLYYSSLYSPGTTFTQAEAALAREEISAMEREGEIEFRTLS